MNFTYVDDLQLATELRQLEWPGASNASLSFRGVELAGEVGEACNVIKKLERGRLGIDGSKTTLFALEEEIADVILCCALIANDCGIDLWGAVCNKFNATSAKMELETRLQGRPTTPPPLPYDPYVVILGDYVSESVRESGAEAVLDTVEKACTVRLLSGVDRMVDRGRNLVILIPANVTRVSPEFLTALLRPTAHKLGAEGFVARVAIKWDDASNDNHAVVVQSVMRELGYELASSKVQ